MLRGCLLVAIVLSSLAFPGDSSGGPPAPDAPPPRADMALLGGKILTLDARDSIVQAVAIREGRILAVGTDAEITRHVGGATKVMRLAGRTVVPGFIETHVHAIGAAQASLGQPYAELHSIAEVQEWIRKRARELPAGTWIEVPRNDITRLAERRHPTPAELDAACTTHPVGFEAARKWVLNSLGFKLLGITDGAKAVPGVRVLRDASGRPRMLVGAGGLVRRFLPYPKCSDEQTLDALTRLLRRYNEVGITSIGERGASRDTYRLYRALGERGVRSIRVVLTFRGSMRTADDVVRFADSVGLKPADSDDWIHIGPLKIMIDGGIHWGNTHLREPYGKKRADFYAIDDPNYRGDMPYTVDQMRDVFAAANRLGWQMCGHITGDAGVDRVLDALEAASREKPFAGRRFTLLHAYFPTPEAIQRGKRLGICVDTQPYLYYKDSEAIAEIYGPSWAERLIGVGDWLRGGIPVAINSDHMIGLDPDHAMNSFNPFLQMYIAVSRKNERGRVWGPRQKISRIDALRSMSTTAAYVNFWEKEVGSLEPGKLADLVVIDRDYLECPEEEIRQIKVLTTIVGGKVVTR